MRDCCANPKLCFALADIALKNFPFLITSFRVIYDSVSFVMAMVYLITSSDLGSTYFHDDNK